VALFEQFGEPMLHGWLYQAAQLVHFEPGRIELRLAPGTPPDLPGRVAAALGRWTARPWLVSLAGSDQDAAPTLAAQAAAERQACIDALAEDPRIKPILQQFPGAAIVDVRPAAAR
jgi:DNA polymerase-3 subunit gamma/tau